MMTAPISVEWVGPESFCVSVRSHQVAVSGASWPGLHGVTPSELLAGAVASSMLYCVEVYLRARGIEPHGLRARCEFAVSRQAPLRIETIAIRLMLPEVPAEIAAGCEQAARGSVLRATLGGDPDVLVSVTTSGQARGDPEPSEHRAEPVPLAPA
jgi:uncharacterized OsmC-like protein